MATVLVLVLAATACTGSGSGAAKATSTTVTVPLTEPTTAPAPTTTPTTLPGNPRTVTTQSPALGPGPARLAGTVAGPDGGAVAGATVLVERLVGDAVAKVAVQTGVGGQWAVESVNGGRYRIRAWRPPDLAALVPTLVFVVASQPKAVNLVVNRYGAGGAIGTVNPNPPVANQPATLVVTISDGGIDADGVLHAQPRPGIPVELEPGPGLVLSSPAVAATDANGNAGFNVACTQVGPLSAIAGVGGGRHALALPNCAAR